MRLSWRMRKFGKGSHQLSNPELPIFLMQTEVNHKPTVSVIIPVRNEEKYLEKCLRSILASDYSSEIEILVVDGESSDRSRELVQMYAARDARIRLLENPGQVAAAAMNIGINHARGSYIVRMDADRKSTRLNSS